MAINLTGSKEIKYQNQGCFCGEMFRQPNARLWLPGMNEGESVAVCIIEDYGETVHLKQEAPQQLGLRPIMYFAAGVLEDGALVLMNKTSVSKFLRRVGLQTRGKENEVLCQWQQRYIEIRNEAMRQRRPELTPEQYHEIEGVHQSTGKSLAFVIRMYFIFLNEASDRGISLNREEHLLSIFYMTKQVNRPIEQVVAGYFAYLTVLGTDPVQEWKFQCNDWKHIFSLANHFSHKDFQVIVEDFFKVFDFSIRREIEESTLWEPDSVFVHDALEFDLPTEDVIEKYEEALGLEEKLRRQKRTKDGLSTNDLARILMTIERNQAAWDLKGVLEEISIHISSSEFLPRSLIYSAGGKAVFILFNKRGKHLDHSEGNDKIVGKGADVVVKDAFDIATQTLCAITIQPKSRISNREIALYEELYPEREPLVGITKIFGWTMWASKRDGITKVGIMMPHYQSNLFCQMERLQEAPWEIRKRLAVELTQGLAVLHKNKIIHRDLKPDNLFLDANDHLFIGDLRRAECEGEVKQSIGGCVWYQSPEYSTSFHPYYELLKQLEEVGSKQQRLRKRTPLKIIDEETNKRLIELEKECKNQTTLAIDIWAVGLILWELFRVEIDDPKIFSEDTVFEDHFLMTWEDYVKNKCWELPFPKEAHWLPGSSVEEGTIAHIVYKCLDPDPQKRPTVEELAYAVEVMTPSRVVSSVDR